MIGVFLALQAWRVDVHYLWRLFLATGSLDGRTTFGSYAWRR